MKANKLLAIFAISALLVGISATNFAYADDSSDNDEDRKEKIAKDKEFKKDQKEEHKEKIDQVKQHKKELREEYKKKFEERKKIFVDYKKELKEKYSDLKNEFKEKYAQLRISTISDVDEDSDDEIESEIKRNELRLLKHEFRENLKNLKLEAKQHFDEFKHKLKDQENDRKNKIHDIINELKEKYKNKIREHDHPSTSDFDSYPIDYERKKIEICHVPPGNPDNAHTLSISVNAMRAHLAHGDYIDECAENVDDETEEKFELTVRAKTFGDQSEVKVKLEFQTDNTDLALIIDEIIENFALTSEEADNALKIEEEDENDLEEKFEVEIEIENEYSEVEVELRFILDTIDREMIIDAIVQKTQLTTEQIEGILEVEPEDENDEGQTIIVELKEELGISQE
jgi:hypothetical protein